MSSQGNFGIPSAIPGMNYQIVETREIPLKSSSYGRNMRINSLQKPNLQQKLVPAPNQMFSQSLLSNNLYQGAGIPSYPAQVQISPKQAFQGVPSAQMPGSISNLSFPIANVGQTNLTSFPNINSQVVQQNSQTNPNVTTRSVEEPVVTYPPEQIQTIQEVVERKIIVRPDPIRKEDVYASSKY